jgi:hypothetical protein
MAARAVDCGLRLAPLACRRVVCAGPQSRECSLPALWRCIMSCATCSGAASIFRMLKHIPLFSRTRLPLTNSQPARRWGQWRGSPRTPLLLVTGCGRRGSRRIGGARSY